MTAEERVMELCEKYEQNNKRLVILYTTCQECNNNVTSL